MLGVRLTKLKNFPEFGLPIQVCFEHIYPDVDYSSFDVGSNFEILEGPRVVGKGTVKTVPYF